MSFRPITDPQKVPVQLNISVPFEYREFLRTSAAKQGRSMNSLIKDVLMSAFPMTRGFSDGDNADDAQSQAPA